MDVPPAKIVLGLAFAILVTGCSLVTAPVRMVTGVATAPLSSEVSKTSTESSKSGGVSINGTSYSEANGTCNLDGKDCASGYTCHITAGRSGVCVR